jgi:hypothetical protein
VRGPYIGGIYWIDLTRWKTSRIRNAVVVDGSEDDIAIKSLGGEGPGMVVV